MTTSRKTVAIVGATGVVGRTIIEVLTERRFDVGTLVPIASEKSQTDEVEAFGNRWPVVRGAAGFDGVDYAFFTAGSSVSREFVPSAIDAGCRVIDNTAAFRMDAGVPLVVPEVNGARVEADTQLVSCPNCTTINLVMALWPLAREIPLERVVVTSFQSVSGAGRSAVEEMEAQSRAVLDGESADATVFPKQIAFNCVPQVGDMTASGNTVEEEKIIEETRKILDAPALDVVPTCVRVPVRVGHSLAVNAEFAGPMSVEDAQNLWSAAPGVAYDEGLPTAVDTAGQDTVCVGRARRDASRPHALSFWVVGDNLRKGAATNSVQIAELMALEALSGL